MFLVLSIMTDPIRAEDAALGSELDDKAVIDHAEDCPVGDKVPHDLVEERTWPVAFQKKTMWKVSLRKVRWLTSGRSDDSSFGHPSLHVRFVRQV